MEKLKVCFIIPKGGTNLSSHFAYLLDFIQAVGEELKVATIIEKASDEKVAGATVQKFSWLPLRTIENLFLCLKFRLRGYKHFYVHYSYVGAVSAIVVTNLLGGKVLYWNCGMPWLFGKQRFLNFLLHKIDYLVTGNETMRKEYGLHFNLALQKIKVMPNWIVGERFNVPIQEKTFLRKKLNIPNGATVVLFLHRLSFRKGSRYLPEIVRKVTTEIPDTYFIIAGGGPDEEWLKKEVGKRENIQFLGAWPQSRVPILMASSDIFIMPSEEEGFPRVIIEAQASGLPYAAFNAGGTKEISPVEEYQYIKAVGDTRGLIEAIITLARIEKEEKERLVRAIKRHSERYEREVVVKTLIEIIKKI